MELPPAWGLYGRSTSPASALLLRRPGDPFFGAIAKEPDVLQVAVQFSNGLPQTLIHERAPGQVLRILDPSGKLSVFKSLQDPPLVRGLPVPGLADLPVQEEPLSLQIEMRSAGITVQLGSRLILIRRRVGPRKYRRLRL